MKEPKDTELEAQVRRRNLSEETKINMRALKPKRRLKRKLKEGSDAN